MATSVTGTSATTTSSSTSTGTKTLSQMTGTDFLKLMITQLQQQDPLEPTSSDELLSQMSTIRGIESDEAVTTGINNLNSSISSLTLQQGITSGSALIGKTIKGTDTDGSDVEGTVTSVKTLNKKVYLELDSGKTLSLENVTGVFAKTQSTQAA